MEIFFYTILFIFWILFWSFSSVIIYRLKSWESGILWGRSHCAKCNNILWSLELIPIFSWLKNLWKCKYCKWKISAIYPFLEISTWILFTLIWYFLIDFNLIIALDINEIIKLFFWLFIWFISIIYTFYDILFLEIHDWVMLTSIIISIIIITLQSFWIINIIPYFSNLSTEVISNNILEINNSIWLLIISVIWLYIIMFKELKEIYDIWILIWILILIYLFNILFTSNISLINFPAIDALIWIYIIFVFFFFQIFVSKWAWMWGWDLRIAILIWLILWYSFSLEWLFATYIVWSFLWVWAIIYSKFRNWLNTTFNSQIPFWPFLSLWFFIVVFSQKTILEIIEKYL